MPYQANNLTRVMLNRAQYMTTEIRAIDRNTLQQTQQNPSLVAPQQTITGTVLVQKQFVIVEWAWLTDHLAHPDHFFALGSILAGENYPCRASAV
jgi:hypothetical protein